MIDRLFELNDLVQLSIHFDNFHNFYLDLDGDHNYFSVLDYIQNLLAQFLISPTVARFLYYDYYNYLINLSPFNAFILPFCHEIIRISENFINISAVREWFAENHIFVCLGEYFTGVLEHAVRGVPYDMLDDLDIPLGAHHVEDIVRAVRPVEVTVLNNNNPIVYGDAQYRTIIDCLCRFYSDSVEEVLHALDTRGVYSWRRAIIGISIFTTSVVVRNAVNIDPNLFIYNATVIIATIVGWSNGCG